MTESSHATEALSRRDAQTAVVAPAVTALGFVFGSGVPGLVFGGGVLQSSPLRPIGAVVYLVGLWLSARAGRRVQRRGTGRGTRPYRDLAAATGWPVGVVRTIHIGSLLVVAAGVAVLFRQLVTD